MGFLTDKRALILGVASNRSIAYGIAKAMRREGAEVAFTHQNERMRDRVGKIADELGVSINLPCDVALDSEIEGLFDQLGQHWDRFDILVHSLAFAPKEELDGNYVANTTREGFRIAHDVSSYSFTALAKAALPMFEGRQGSLLSLSYLGAERAVPNYNVMGVAKASLEANVRYMAAALGPQGHRVNAVSAGPIRTLAAAGIGDFRKFLDHVETYAPLRRNVNIDEVGNAAAFLCSDLASGITGEVLYVDSGYNIVGTA